RRGVPSRGRADAEQWTTRSLRRFRTLRRVHGRVGGLRGDAFRLGVDEVGENVSLGTRLAR
ncbi:MAG: hypothetical protein AAB426_06885, partial [Myxococcota bacterium]